MASILPINEDRYAGRAPYLVISLFVINGLVLAATYLSGSSQLVFSRYGFTPAHAHILTVFSSLFLHVGIFHYAGNMFFLWMFGYRVENALGRWLFLLLFLLCGCGANELHYLLNQSSTVPCVGASGAISGVAGSYLVLFPDSRFDIDLFFGLSDVKNIPMNASGAVGVWVLEQILLGLLTRIVPISSTAFWSHIGGFVTGVLATLVLTLILPGIKTRGESALIVRYLKGVVRDADGNPLPNARFELWSGSVEPIAATTSPKGRFDIGRVPDGWYSFAVSKEGWVAVQGNILVRKGAQHSVPLNIQMSQQQNENVSTAEHGELQGR